MRLLMVIFALLAIVRPAHAQNFPNLSGVVVDSANILSDQDEAMLTDRLSSVQTADKLQFVVVTVPSLDGLEPFDYAYKLGRYWEIGSAEKDDGIVLLVAPNEREVWIATGYGARISVPDVVAGRIVRDAIIPRFKADDYAGGIMAGVDGVLEYLALPPDIQQRKIDEAINARSGTEDGGELVGTIIFFMIFAFFIMSKFRRTHGRRYRGTSSDNAAIILWGLDAAMRASRGSRGGGWSGGFGGGGFSGGGGSFGGGGAGGSW